MRNRWIAILLVCSMILSCAACSMKKTNAPDEKSTKEQTSGQDGKHKDPKDPNEKITLRIGFSTDASDPRVEASKVFQSMVEEQTEGRITVELHADGELGSDAELIQGIIDGKVEMTVSSAGNFANYATKVGVSAFPFLFSNFEDAWAFMDGEEERKIEEELEEYNIKVLAHFDNGFRCVTTSKKVGPIQSVADMEGLKIRTPENQIVMETLSALGANPYVLNFTELYDALQKGEFDAQENPVPIIYNHKLYEVQSYLAVTNHSYDAMPFVIGNDIWEQLTEEDQEILQTAALEAQKQNRQMIQTQTAEYVKKLEKKGMTITYPDLEEFKQATTKVYDYFADSYGEELMNLLKNQ